MASKQIFHSCILPLKYKEDTIGSAKIVIENILTLEDFKVVITKCINYTNKIILKCVVQYEPFSKFIKRIQQESDIHYKKRIINEVLESNDTDIFDCISSVFDIKDIIPESSKLSDISFVPDRYDEDFINVKTNINYLTDIQQNVRHFEEYIADFRSVYNAGCDLVLQFECQESTYESKDAFNNLLEAFKRSGIKHIKEEELKMIKRFAIDYYYFIENDYDEIIEDICNAHDVRDSKNDCVEILYDYLDRYPTRWETDMLWDMM